MLILITNSEDIQVYDMTGTWMVTKKIGKVFALYRLKEYNFYQYKQSC